MSIVFKKPLTFEMGLGVTGSLNGKVTGSFSMGDGKDDNNINFNIAQPVDPTASPTFNTICGWNIKLHKSYSASWKCNLFKNIQKWIDIIR